ncbi:MAG: type II toxin-antitoxin system death-on-curing family toxin [Verrucomicrobia bacterium]|nr:type II toxin-antitoxin system death-on-curing family toxin [Verrucomicrobiota bacterium]
MHPTIATVKSLHEQVLRVHGGSAGIREENLLESAVAAPQATMMGRPMIEDPIEVAASYLFYLCRNHPFVDGNKRAALACRNHPFVDGNKRAALATCLVFLSQNGLLPDEVINHDALEAFVLDVAAGRIDRGETTKRLKKLLKRR